MLQNNTIRELKETFSNADSIRETEAGGRLILTFTKVSADCQNRWVNVFSVGPRGGVKVIKNEFNQFS